VSDLTPEHRDLMTEHHDLGLLGRLAATQQHKPAEDPDRDQVGQPKSHDWRSCRSMLIRAKLQVTDLRGVLTRYMLLILFAQSLTSCREVPKTSD